MHHYSCSTLDALSYTQDIGCTNILAAHWACTIQHIRHAPLYRQRIGHAPFSTLGMHHYTDSTFGMHHDTGRTLGMHYYIEAAYWAFSSIRQHIGHAPLCSHTLGMHYYIEAAHWAFSSIRQQIGHAPLCAAHWACTIMQPHIGHAPLHKLCCVKASENTTEVAMKRLWTVLSNSVVVLLGSPLCCEESVHAYMCRTRPSE